MAIGGLIVWFVSKHGGVGGVMAKAKSAVPG
jgi:hypothetical protein